MIWNIFSRLHIVCLSIFSTEKFAPIISGIMSEENLEPHRTAQKVLLPAVCWRFKAGYISLHTIPHWALAFLKAIQQHSTLQLQITIPFSKFHLTLSKAPLPLYFSKGNIEPSCKHTVDNCSDSAECLRWIYIYIYICIQCMCIYMLYVIFMKCSMRCQIDWYMVLWTLSIHCIFLIRRKVMALRLCLAHLWL